MIRSLYQLTTKINSHIEKLHHIRDFKLNEIQPIVNNYLSNDWEEYKNKNPVKHLSLYNNYSRIPIIFDKLELGKKDLYDMFLIIWEPKCHTSIHTQPDGDCIIKVLEGNIVEQRFQNNETCTEVKCLSTNDLSFMSEHLGLHRIINSNDSNSYSLHIYSPPIYYPEFESELKQYNAEFFKKTPFLARTMMLDKKQYTTDGRKHTFRDLP
jgi:hypothetical protein